MIITEEIFVAISETMMIIFIYRDDIGTCKQV